MSRLAWLALVASVAASAIALTDAVSVGLTGSSSVFGGPLSVVSTLVHGLMYASLAAVLLVEADAIDAGHASTRWLRRALVVSYVPLAVLFLAGTVTMTAEPPPALGAVTTAAFLASFPLSAALGITLLTRRTLRVPAVLLALVPAGLIAVSVLGAAGSRWAHPACAEVLQYLGVALLGRGTTSDVASTARPGAVSRAA